MSDRSLTTWHFFRRDTESELWCAVPADKALPPFLLSGHWRFSGHRRGSDDAPPGFDDGAAAVAERFNGFYLFQLVGLPPNQRRAPSRFDIPASAFKRNPATW